MNIERLKMLRKNKNITQKEISEALGFTNQQRYGAYETGIREADNDTLKQLAEFFSVSIDYLLGATNDPTPPNKKSSPKMKSASFLQVYLKSGGI